MKLLHRTPFAESILKIGFRDGEGTYMNHGKRTKL